MTTDSPPKDTGGPRQRATERIVTSRLRDFVTPSLEADRLDWLNASVAHREAEGGAPADF